MQKASKVGDVTGTFTSTAAAAKVHGGSQTSSKLQTDFGKVTSPHVANDCSNGVRNGKAKQFDDPSNRGKDIPKKS